MNLTGESKLTIVIHETVNAMAIRQEGKITRLRATKPGRLWAQPSPCRTMANLSLASCKLTCVVLRATMKLS